MKTYPLNLTQFAALRLKLLGNGITLPSDSQGVLSFKGIELKYAYDGAKLTLSILKRPMLIPPSMIWEQVDKWVQGG
jgi:hypothetical protein